MVNVLNQQFYESNGTAHDVVINFGWVSMVSNGHYSVTVDGKEIAKAKHKGNAFDAVADLLKETGWSGIDRT